MDHDQGHGIIDHEIMEFSWVMMSANSNLKVRTESKEPCWDLEYFLLFLRFSILQAQWSNTPTSWHNVTPCVHCVLHHRWVKTRGMCLDARADFWGKKVVFSQTNSHLLSGRGGGKKEARRQLSRHPPPPAPPAWMLNLAFAKPIKRRTQISKKHVNFSDWTLMPGYLLVGCWVAL